MDPKAPIASGNQRLFNNPNKSDIRFLVDGQTLYGHKQVLAKGSSVFESMFFGQTKEKRKVIEVDDVTLVGFKNALRYLYGFKIDYEIAHLYESYRAADKYLLIGFNEAFLNHIKNILTAKNSCLVYEQLIKIDNPEEIPFTHVKAILMEHSREAFASEHFTQINQETLISLLSLKQLNITEFEQLAAVSKWVTCEVRRQGLSVTGENRRRVFKPIKPYIRFTALSGEKFAGCKEMVELIPPKELTPLLLHLLNKANPLTIEQKTPRSAGTSTYSVFVSESDSFDYDSYDYDEPENFNEVDMRLTADQSVFIRTIHTTYSERFKDLKIKIYGLDRAPVKLEVKRFVKDGRFSFSLEPPFELMPKGSYKLVATSTEYIDEVTEQKDLNYKDRVHFTVERRSANWFECHCIRGLEFSFC